MSEQVIGVNTALMHGFTSSLIKYVNDIVEQNDSNNDNKEDYYLFFVDFLKNLIESSQQELKNSIGSADICSII